MNRTHGALGRAADRVMGLDSAAYGDERERAVFMEAATFGYAVATYVTIGVALVAAVFGTLLLPVVLLLVCGLPSLSAIWYAGRRGVDVDELAQRAAGGTKRTIGAIVFGGFALTLAAMAWTVFTGHGLVPLPEVDVAGPEASGMLASMVKGGVIGGAGGLLLAAVTMAVKSRRTARTGGAVDDDADED